MHNSAPCSSIPLRSPLVRWPPVPRPLDAAKWNVFSDPDHTPSGVSSVRWVCALSMYGAYIDSPLSLSYTLVSIRFSPALPLLHFLYSHTIVYHSLILAIPSLQSVIASLNSISVELVFDSCAIGTSGTRILSYFHCWHCCCIRDAWLSLMYCVYTVVKSVSVIAPVMA